MVLPAFTMKKNKNTKPDLSRHFAGNDGESGIDSEALNEWFIDWLTSRVGRNWEYQIGARFTACASAAIGSQSVFFYALLIQHSAEHTWFRRCLWCTHSISHSTRRLSLFDVDHPDMTVAESSAFTVQVPRIITATEFSLRWTWSRTRMNKEAV